MTAPAARSDAADGIAGTHRRSLRLAVLQRRHGPRAAAGAAGDSKDIAVLWICMSACIPTYMLASALIDGGMNWWQAVLTIFLGNLIVLVPMILNAHAGTKYGIPFPVYCRASFGIRGANVPALLRALVACGWFGIQTWIGGEAIYVILTVFFPRGSQLAPLPLTRHQRGATRLLPAVLGRSTCSSSTRGSSRSASC